MLVLLVALLAVQGVITFQTNNFKDLMLSNGDCSKPSQSSQPYSTSIGDVMIIGLRDPVPIGWEDMSF